MRRILVIDDEEVVRKSICNALKLEGYESEDVPDAISANEVLKADPPEIVITDLLLPGKDGFEIIEELKRDYPEIKIIAMSGGGTNLFDAETALLSAKRSGADYTLEKPFKRKDLLTALGVITSPPKNPTD